MRWARASVITMPFMTAGAFASPLAAQATIGGDWREDVAQFAHRLVDAGLTPGMGVAVSIGDRVAYAAGFGRADMATGRAATGDTPFYIASTTKSLTGLAAVLAAHSGELDLDAPMVRYLPAARLPDGVARESITVRDLLTLTHGLAGDGPVVLRTAYTGQFTTAQLLDLLRYHRATGAHGTFSYNNLGYNLLGLVLESVYGAAWQDVVHRLVIEPLGLARTTARLSSLPPDVIALPHDWTPAGFARAELGKADANMHAAGGHFASAHDLARYTAAHVSGGIVDGQRVLPAAPVLATREQRIGQQRQFGPFHRFGWGYGLDLATYDGDTLVSRFGSFSGYRSHVSFMPRHEIGVVVLVNGGGPAFDVADIVATYIYDRLLGKPGLEARYGARVDSLTRQAQESRRVMAAHLAERRARLAPLPYPLSRYAGTYENALLGRMEWRVVAGGLEMTLGVVHSRAEVFDASKHQLRIEVGGGGQVAEFRFPEAGGPARGVRLAGQEFARAPPP
ncbi:MAG TPA: serine hydrolase [Gemmatimonadaceae bacterium]|nr:serine hydrolase [Gemmatimonadaceae bacterium]